uniref:CCHC-type domain-containing protein n=1 Tax=Tanacetum cinerariifolium TaxID=118510 RepID=A0A6L2N3R1_TANCI|nr:hypothetical protein [Tanacetum cinerariifolium]
MLLEVSELTGDERESQLYDDFEHFRQKKGEIVHEYYVKGRQNRVQRNHARGPIVARNRGVQNRVGNANPGQAKRIKCYDCDGIGPIARQCTHLKRPLNSKYFKDKMLLMQAPEKGVVLDKEQLLSITCGEDNSFDDDMYEPSVALNVDRVFQADQCNAFKSDVDEAPTTQTMFMANLSSADLIYDEVDPSYDSDILSEVEDHDNYLDSVGEYHEVHEMQNDVRQNYVVKSNAEYTSDSNIIPYEQYVKDNAKQVVQSNVSSMPNDALMMIINEDTLELAEITRKKMIEKMNCPLCVEKKIKISPLDYSKENYLATFTPQRQLFAKQIFWSSVSKPISKMIVYPPNTPARLGIQTALIKEVKEMKEIFEQMEAEVEQYVMDKKCVEIKKKNLFIENENLLADCLSNELLYSVMNAVNTISRFSELHDAYPVKQACETSHDAPEFDSFFEINKMKEQLQGKNNTIRKLKD